MRFLLGKIVEFAMTKPPEVDRGYKQFFGNLSFYELEPEWEELFHEWLIFDYKQLNGMSFIIEYVLKNPDVFEKDKLNKIKQIAKTNFYSQFEIVDLKRGKWLRLEDLFTGKIYKVYEKKGSESINSKGVIPSRIAKVNTRYYLVGANAVYFPTTYTKRAKKHMTELKIKNFSPKNILELLVSHNQYNAKPPRVPTKKEIKAKKKKLEKKYKKCASAYKVTLVFEKLINEIYNEDKSTLDFWRGLENKGLNEKFLFKHHKLLQDIWNYFPHRCLNNLSPIEMYSKMKAGKT